MRTLLLAICILLFTGVGYAEEGDTVSNNACPGNWVLQKPSGWVVRNETGVILPLSAGTEILGCGQIPTSLSDDLTGASVSIVCAPSPVENGLPDIVSLRIICE
jgi:hypothetical protein